MFNALLFLALRYTVFVLFVLCNSVICVVAALNLGSLLPNTDRAPEVVSYLIFVAAFGLVLIFPVVFIEMIRRNAFISQVRFEISWVALFWIMHLAGASAVSAILPDISCSRGPTIGVSIPNQPVAVCSSTQVLLAFTWLSAVTLLIYLIILIAMAVVHHKDDPLVWRSGVRDFRWFTHVQSLHSLQANTRVEKGYVVGKPDTSDVPRIYAMQMGLSDRYTAEPLSYNRTSDAEHFVPPVPAKLPDIRSYSFPPQPHPVGAASQPPLLSRKPASMYPQPVQSSIETHPTTHARNSEPSPPPAGAWPRKQPQEPEQRRKPLRPGQPPLQSLSHAAHSVVSEQPVTPQVQQPTVISSSPPRTRRPSGPRFSERPRPPPLDLSRISSSLG